MPKKKASRRSREEASDEEAPPTELGHGFEKFHPRVTVSTCSTYHNLATASRQGESGSACGPEMHGGKHCVRFVLHTANRQGSLPYVGVVGKGFDPARRDASESRDGWSER